MSPAEPTENAQAQQQNNQQLYPQAKAAHLNVRQRNRQS